METEKPEENGIDARIRVIRGISVMLDFDLAALYGVTTSALLQAMKRNQKRFPQDFVFQLTNHELTNLRSASRRDALKRSGANRVR